MTDTVWEVLGQALIYLIITFSIRVCYTIQKEYSEKGEYMDFGDYIRQIGIAVIGAIAVPLFISVFSGFITVLKSTEIAGLMAANFVAGMLGLFKKKST